MTKIFKEPKSYIQRVLMRNISRMNPANYVEDSPQPTPPSGNSLVNIPLLRHEAQGSDSGSGSGSGSGTEVKVFYLGEVNLPARDSAGNTITETMDPEAASVGLTIKLDGIAEAEVMGHYEELEGFDAYYLEEDVLDRDTIIFFNATITEDYELVSAPGKIAVAIDGEIDPAPVEVTATLRFIIKPLVPYSIGDTLSKIQFNTELTDDEVSVIIDQIESNAASEQGSRYLISAYDADRERTHNIITAGKAEDVNMIYILDGIPLFSSEEIIMDGSGDGSGSGSGSGTPTVIPKGWQSSFTIDGITLDLIDENGILDYDRLIEQIGGSAVSDSKVISEMHSTKYWNGNLIGKVVLE